MSFTMPITVKMCETSVKIIENEVDVGMTPCQKLLKQEGTVRRIESIFHNSFSTSRFLRVAEDCCMLLILRTVPSCFNRFWHGVIPTSNFTFNDFYSSINRLVHQKMSFVQQYQILLFEVFLIRGSSVVANPHVFRL